MKNNSKPSLRERLHGVYKKFWARCLYFEFLRDLYKMRVKLFPWWIPVPQYIEVENTTRCNLKCVMCEHTYWNEPARDMTFEQFKSIVDDIPKLKWIGMTGIGESFLNKDYMKMLRYLTSKSIWVELFDPFLFIDEEKAKELLKTSVGVIYVSIDAATKETYEKIRVGANFDVVVKNIKNFIKLKKKMKKDRPEILYHYIISKYNIHEVVPFIDLVHSFGEKNSKILYTTVLHEFNEIKDLAVEAPPELREKGEKRGEELDIKILWNANVPEKKRPITRCFAWLMPFIFVTGHVTPCCALNEQNRRDFQEETSFGNIFEQSFEEIWKGKKFTEFRKKILRGEVPTQCRACTIYDVGNQK